MSRSDVVGALWMFAIVGAISQGRWAELAAVVVGPFVLAYLLRLWLFMAARL